jgi:pseudaminic acid cytidylyltransferase
MKIHAVVPARGKSKRVPDKNIRLLDGIPVIVHVIRLLKNVSRLSSIVVSTDSPVIANIALAHGASVPFLRSHNLSDDHTPTHPVIKDSISRTPWIDDGDIILCVYPFAVLLDPADLERAINTYLEESPQDHYLVSVVRYSHPIERSFHLDLKQNLIPRFSSELSKRTQDLSISYHDAGQFYIGSSLVWNSHSNILNRARGFVIPKKITVDVDTEEDFEELLLRWSLQEIQAQARVVE